jgi:hypothetical protein
MEKLKAKSAVVSSALFMVGDVTTSGNGWEEAKMRLWIVS